MSCRSRVALLIMGGVLALSGAGSVISYARAVSPIRLELNKLEPIASTPPGCRAYFVVSNPAPTPIPELRLDLVLFGTDGVISRRVALDLGPLPARKEVVRLFDLSAISCDSIGQILLNDVLACQLGDKPPASTGGENQTCLDRITLSSRAKASLTK